MDMTMVSMITALSLFSVGVVQSQGEDGGSCFRAVRRNNTITILALLSIHQPSSYNTECAAISTMDVQTMVAVQWMTTLINEQDFIPGVKLDMKMYDTCGIPALATRAALQSLPDIYPDYYPSCRQDIGDTPVLGILGPSCSGPAEAVSDALKGRNIPQVAFSTTVSKFFNKTLFPSYFCTTPSDLHQIQAIVAIVRRLNWTYVATVNTDDNYGTEGIEEFHKLSKASGICIAMSETISVSPPTNDITSYNIIRKISMIIRNNASSILGVVYFGQAPAAVQLLKVWAENIQLSTDLHPSQLRWIFPDSIEVNIAHSWHLRGAVSDGTITLAPAFSEIADFRNHWLGLMKRVRTRNETCEADCMHYKLWLDEYFMEYYNCLFTDATVPKELLSKMRLRFQRESGRVCEEVTDSEIESSFVQTHYVEKAMEAVLALASAVKNAQNVRCNNVPGLCQSLKNMNSSSLAPYLANATLEYNRFPRLFPNKTRGTFDANGDLNNSDSNHYFVNQLKSGTFQRIGSHSPSGLKISLALDDHHASSCRQGCSTCKTNVIEEIPFAYVPGKVLILGIFSLHEAKRPTDCGAFRSLTGSVPLVEAFLYAMDTLNQSRYPSSRSGNKPNFGAIVLDDCYNALRASQLLLNFFSGNLILKDPKSGEKIDSKLVAAVVGAFSSSVSMTVADILTALKIPLISYGSVSTDLSNREAYPYFLRTVPAIDGQARAMVMMLRSLGWEYVATINSENHYARAGIRAFKKFANASKICIALSQEMPFSKAESEQIAPEIVQNLLNYPAANVVVLMLDDFLAREVLMQMNGRRLGGRYILVGSEGWSDSVNVIKGLENMAEGHLTFRLEKKTRDFPEFDRYIRSLKPGTNHRNPWFKTYWEENFNCYLPNSLANSRPPCGHSLVLNSEDPWTVYTILAVYAAANGIETALEEVCGTTELCPLMRSTAGVSTLYDEIKKVRLRNDFRELVVPFDDNGDGSAGFEILNIQKVETHPKYVGVGLYTESRGLELRERDIRLHNQRSPAGNESECARGDPNCLQCLAKTADPEMDDELSCPQCLTTNAAVTVKEDAFSEVNPFVLAVLVLLSVVLTIVVAVLVKNFYCQRRKERNPPGTHTIGRETYPRPQQRHSRRPGETTRPRDSHSIDSLYVNGDWCRTSRAVPSSPLRSFWNDELGQSSLPSSLEYNMVFENDLETDTIADANSVRV